MPNNIQTIIDKFDEEFNIGNNNQGIIFEDDDGINRVIPLSKIKQFLKDSLTSMLDGIEKELKPSTTKDGSSLEEDAICYGKDLYREEVINIINSNR